MWSGFCTSLPIVILAPGSRCVPRKDEPFCQRDLCVFGEEVADRSSTRHYPVAAKLFSYVALLLWCCMIILCVNHSSLLCVNYFFK